MFYRYRPGQHIIRHLIAELRGDVWIVDGRVLIEAACSELSDDRVAALTAEAAGVDDAVVTLRRPDGRMTTHRIRPRPEPFPAVTGDSTRVG